MQQLFELLECTKVWGRCVHSRFNGLTPITDRDFLRMMKVHPKQRWASPAPAKVRGRGAGRANRFGLSMKVLHCCLPPGGGRVCLLRVNTLHAEDASGAPVGAADGAVATHHHTVVVAAMMRDRGGRVGADDAVVLMLGAWYGDHAVVLML
eukprot:gene16334-56210_t